MKKTELLSKFNEEINTLCTAMSKTIISLIKNSDSYKSAKKVKSTQVSNINIHYVFNTPSNNVNTYTISIDPYSTTIEDTDSHGILENGEWAYYVTSPYQNNKNFNLKIWEYVKNDWNVANLIKNKIYELNSLPDEIDKEYVKNNCQYINTDDLK